ncbi:MAG: hypothetical protein QOJ89_364 [bacterium]
MRLSDSQRRALKADARELLMRVCAAAGLLAGMWLALQNPAPHAPVSCETAGTARIGACFNDVLFSTALPYVLSMSAGLVIGGFAGWLVGTLLTQPDAGAMRRAPRPGAPRATARAPHARRR